MAQSLIYLRLPGSCAIGQPLAITFKSTIPTTPRFNREKMNRASVADHTIRTSYARWSTSLPTPSCLGTMMVANETCIASTSASGLYYYYAWVCAEMSRNDHFSASPFIQTIPFSPQSSFLHSSTPNLLTTPLLHRNSNTLCLAPIAMLQNHPRVLYSRLDLGFGSRRWTWNFRTVCARQKSGLESRHLLANAVLHSAVNRLMKLISNISCVEDSTKQNGVEATSQAGHQKSLGGWAFCVWCRSQGIHCAVVPDFFAKFAFATDS